MTLLSELEKNYNIEGEVGSGGMGIVYSAIDKRLERKVAIKVLSLSSSNNDINETQEIIQRFQREARSIARLSHSNIVNIYDLGQVDESYYMVMEYLEGKSLDKILEKNKNISPSLVTNIGAQICNALDYAHQNGVIHRDIKPGNIILSPKGVAKLTDFGIAQLTSEQKKLTQTGSILGSIMYIPPEQLENSANIDHRADIYSLGVTLYQLLTGLLPFDADNASEIIFKILKEIPQIPSTHNPEIPHSLDHIIIKSLLKSPEQRFQSAQEMGLELSRLISNSNFYKDTLINVFRNDLVTNEESKFSTSVNYTKTILKKTTINQSLITTLSKDYSWIDNLTKEWKTDEINNVSPNQLISKLMEPTLFGKAFTGIFVIDKNINIFIFEGNFIGAVNKLIGKIGNEVFENLPKTPSNMELKTAPEEQFQIPVIISSIAQNTGKSVQKNLDSSMINLSAYIENINEEKSFSGYISCYTEDNIYYAGFFKGIELFCTPINNNLDNPNKILLKDVVLNKSMIFNSYEIEPEICNPNIENLLKSSTLSLNYKDESKTKLYDIVHLDNQEVPLHIIKEAKQNTFVQLILNQTENINIFGKVINLSDMLKKSLLYRFVDWVFSEYFYLLNSTGNITALKYIYSWIPAVENIVFFETLNGEDGNPYNFDIVFHGQIKDENYKKVLFLVKFGSGKKEDLNKTIEESIQVKKKLIKSGDIGGVIYISKNEIDSNSLKLFYERTVEPRKGFGLGALDKLTKYKGFVRIGFGRGFHLNLIEYNKDTESFNVIAPLLK